MDSSLARRIDELLADQRDRWQLGERIRVETYLKQHPELAAHRDALLDLVYHEFLLQRETGEIPTLESYLQRFPDLAEDLRIQIEVHDALDTYLPPETVGAKRTTANGPAVQTPSIPDYEILEVLGRGGMGVVYRARQISLGRLVALKMIKAGALAGPEELIRFRMEAEAIARLQHPNIVQIYAVGQYEGRPYLALEHIDGDSLAKHLAVRPQPPDQAAQVIETLARAMHYAHLRGIVHRDLKPANILLSEELRIKSEELRVKNENRDSPEKGDLHEKSLSTLPSSLLTPKITDFGLAKFTESEEGFTETGGVLGTVTYMAPEQAAGKNRIQKIGPATDVYALGVILYEMLTGRVPFEGGSIIETLDMVCREEPTSPRALQPKIPRDLENICLKCLQKEPFKRYRDAEQLAEDLRRFRAGQPVLARPIGVGERLWKWTKRNPGRATAAAALLLLLIGGGFALRAEALRRAETERGVERTLKQLSGYDGTAQAQIASGQFAEADATLGTAMQVAADDPRLAVRREEIEAKQKRIQKLARFYLLAKQAWARAGEENYEAALETSLSSLKSIGVLDHPSDWPAHLPIEDLAAAAQEIDRLEVEAFRQILLLSAFRTFAGLRAQLTFRPKAEQETAFHSALEVLAWAKVLEEKRRQPLSCVVSILERVNRKGLNQPDTTATGKSEPVTAIDYYFLGLIHYFMASQSDYARSRLAGYFRDFTDLDQETPMETAKRLLQKAVRLDPNSYWPWWVLGRTLISLSQYESALLAFNACVQLDPNYARGREQRAYVLAYCSRLAKTEREREDFRREVLTESDLALQLAARDHDSATWWMRAETLAILLMEREALDAYAAGVELEPEVQFKVARSKALDKAARYANDLIKAHAGKEPARPLLADAHALLALTHLTLNKKEDAEKEARSALELDANHPRAKRVLEKLGK